MLGTRGISGGKDLRIRRTLGVSVTVMLLAAACTAAPAAPTQAPATQPPATQAPATQAPATDAPATRVPGIGEGEGELNLVIWAGYAERGATDPNFDWVTPFEEETGCTVNTTDMTDSNNGVSLMQSGNYDGISASGDATTRLIEGGYVEAI